MKKIKLDRNEQFNKVSYDTEGIYHNTETDEILMLSNRMAFVVFLGTYNDCGHLFAYEEDKKGHESGTVTESFALKLAAVLTNSDKLKEYEI